MLNAYNLNISSACLFLLPITPTARPVSAKVVPYTGGSNLASMSVYASSTEPQYGQAPGGTQERDDPSLPSHFQSQSAVNGYRASFTNNYDHIDETQLAGAPHGDYTMVPPEIAAYYRQQASSQQDAPPSSLPSASSSTTWSTNGQCVNGGSIGTTQYWTSGNQQFQSYPPASQQYQSSGQNVYQSVPMPLQGSIVGSSAVLAHPAPSATIGNPSSASSTSTYNNLPQTQLVGDNAPNQVYVESHDAPLGGTTSLTQDPSRNRAESSSSQHSLHSDSIGHGHMQQYPVTGASRTFVDPLHHGKQDSGYWNGNNQQYAQPHLQQQHQQQMASSAPLHRSASAGNIASQQYQAVDLPQSAYNYAHRGSVSALPTVSRFGGQHITTSGRPGMLRGLSHGVGQMAYNDSATDKEVLASPKATDRPSLSLHTDASALGTGWVSGPSTGEAFQRSASSGSHPEYTYAFVQNPAPVSAISQQSNATYRSQYSNDSSHASLRPGPSIVNQQYGQRDVYDMRESPYTGPAADSWPRSLSNTNASSGHGETHPQPFYNGGGETNVYQRSSRSGDSGGPTRRASSSIPSTPELSRQQSSSSFRSPSSELSQVQGFFAPVQQPIVHNTASHRAHDQPIPEMMSIDFKERTHAVDTWARLPSRPEGNDEANALLK